MIRPRQIRHWLIAGLLAASALRCGDNVGPADGKIEMAAGNGQSGAVQQPLPDPLVVLVSDVSGAPLAGVTVHWAAVGGGSVSNETTQTGSDGHASVERVLGPTAGQQSTTASVAGYQGSPVTFVSTAVDGGSPGLTLTTQPPS